MTLGKLETECYRTVPVARNLAAGKKRILLREKKGILPPC